MSKSEDGVDGRFRWRAGSKPSLYGLNRLPAARKAGFAVLCEGESDCHTAWFHDEPAFGIPGAGNWRDNRDAHHFEGIEAIYAVVEPDQGGAGLLEKLRASKLRDQIRVVRLGDLKDISGLYLDDPNRFAQRWGEAKASAEPLTLLMVREGQERRLELEAAAQQLAHEPDLLARFALELRSSGVVGEDRAAKLLYLIVTSRLLSRPLSAVVKGPSSAGKSFLTERVLRFFPDAAYYALSAMSERALAYSDEPLSHRMLVIYEAAGISSDYASYLLRSLLSEGCVRYETVEKTTEGLQARLIIREGPTGAIITTTALRLHAENETRMLSIPVNDTPAQTAAVLMAQAGGNGPGVDYTPWHAFQDWIASGNREVEIPFARELAASVPPAAVRLRRDFPALLTLIRTHALLHQMSRELNEEGRIVATLEDYSAVRELVADLVSEGIEASVSHTVTETVQATAAVLADGKDEATNLEVARALGLDKATALRRVRSAIDLGYLRNLEERRGRPARLILGAPLPVQVDVLPSRESLRGCTVAVSTEGVKMPPTESRPSNLLPDRVEEVF